MYDELAASIAAGLLELGHSCGTAVNELRAGAINILLGSTIFAARSLSLYRQLGGQPYILYQLEQLDDRLGLLPQLPEYREVMAGAARIWDYAPSSGVWLRERGFAAVDILSPGYHACLETIQPQPRQDIDVLFAGSPHPRRQIILDSLKRQGVSVTHLHGVYGEQRDQALARAKIVLNMHAWDGLDALETIRLSFLLANRRFVVSETGDHDPYGGGVVFARHAELAETCLYYLGQSPEHRAAIAGRGYQAVRSQSMTEALRPLAGSA